MIHRFIDHVAGSIIYVVLELAGDYNIWAVTQSPGQDPARISTNTFDVRQGPELSSDGTKIAYERNTGDYSELWVMDADGSNDQLLDDNGDTGYCQYPSWAPDSSHIIYTANGGGSNSGGEIRRIDPDGTNGATLWTPPTNGAARRPRYSYDGSKIAFLVNDDGIGGAPFYSPDEIWTMDDDGSNDTVIDTLVSSEFGECQFAWANLSNVLAYYEGDNSVPTIGGVHKINADGTGKTLLATLSDGTAFQAISDRAWSPDDSKVYIAAKESGTLGLGWYIHECEADGSGETLLYDGHVLYDNAVFIHPYLHGSRLYFVPAGRTTLNSISLDGTDHRVEHTLSDASVGDFFYAETGFDNR